MIVVDTNILAYLHIDGPRKSEAEALLALDDQWAAPPIWRSEFRNVLSGYLRRKQVSFARACVLQHEAEELLHESEFDVDSLLVLELVRDSECTSYDCEFIALAMQLDVRLVTADKQLLRAFPQHAVSLAQATSSP